MRVVLLEVSLINFILGISNEIKWKMKLDLLKVSMMILHSSDIQGYQMEGEIGVTRKIIDEIQSSDI